MSSQFDSDIKKAKAAVNSYHKNKNIQNLNEAVEAWERILQHPYFTGKDINSRLNVLNDSAETYFLRYEATDNFNDLNEAIRLQKKAVDIAEKADSPKLTICLKLLDKYARELSTRNNNRPDLLYSISISKKLIDLIRKKDPNSPELPLHIENLKKSLSKSDQSAKSPRSNRSEPVVYC